MITRITLLFLCSCATGISDLPEEPTSEVSSQSPTNNPFPNQTIQDTCITNKYWVNNCFVIKTYCDDVLKDMDVMCHIGRPLQPWEYIPDPSPWMKVK